MSDKTATEEQVVEEVNGTVELGLTADNMADMKALIEEDEPKETKAQPEVEKKEDDLTDRLTKLEEKLEKTQASSQSRIDKLTAEKKQLAEELAELRAKSKEADPDPVDRLVATRDKLLAEKKRIKKQIYEAQIDGDNDKYDSLIEEETKVDLSILRLDKEYDKIEQAKETQLRETATQKEIERSRDDWNNCMRKAVDQFPELKTEDGKLNEESTLWKESIKRMLTNATPAKNLPFLKQINPDYDSPNGPFQAILETFVSLNSNKSNKKVRDVERENNNLKAKEQLLTQTMATADRTDTFAKRRANALQAVIDNGEDTFEADEFLRLENRRLGLTK